MKHSPLAHPAPSPRGDRLCTAIVSLALVLIAVLAIPMCIFLGAIIAVWSAADKLVQRIDAHAAP